mmetsp:Transcript_38325/g.99871  ORF Transcript_38325/g.99871 Transcript_38325/m.99871 type:complete len:150 (-) Transcript_38325:333-782(-)
MMLVLQVAVALCAISGAALASVVPSFSCGSGWCHYEGCPVGQTCDYGSCRGGWCTYDACESGLCTYASCGGGHCCYGECPGQGCDYGPCGGGGCSYGDGGCSVRRPWLFLGVASGCLAPLCCLGALGCLCCGRCRLQGRARGGAPCTAA